MLRFSAQGKIIILSTLANTADIKYGTQGGNDSLLSTVTLILGLLGLLPAAVIAHCIIP